MASYDWQWPDLMTGPQRIEITFSLKNAHPVTAPDFLVVIDPCKRSVISLRIACGYSAAVRE